MKKFIRIGILLWMVLGLFSCEKTMEYYYGIPMQPKFFEKSDWEKVVNVFGLIRPDSGNMPMSFVYAQQTFPTKGAEDKDYTLKNAVVHIYTTSVLGQEDTINMSFYEDSSGETWSFPRYVSNQLKVEAGMKYELEIKSPGLPDVRASAKMPEVPKMVIGSLKITSEKIQFSLQPDSLAFLYEVFLFSDSSFTSKIFLRENTGMQLMEWKLTINDRWKQLVVYAFDKNMAQYMTTATSSFYSFNVYRPPVSTVNGGYGCFGAMNSNMWELK